MERDTVVPNCAGGCSFNFFFSRCELFASRVFQKEGQLIKLWSRNLLTAQNKFKANGL